MAFGYLTIDVKGDADKFDSDAEVGVFRLVTWRVYGSFPSSSPFSQQVYWK